MKNDPSFRYIGVVQKDGCFISAGQVFMDKCADMGQIYRDVPDNFGAYINPSLLKINEGVLAEILVVVMAMDNPAIKFFTGIRRIVNQQKTKAFVFERNRCNILQFSVIVIPPDKGDVPFEFFPVLKLSLIHI